LWVTFEKIEVEKLGSYEGKRVGRWECGMKCAAGRLGS
jgi:hypothetical protein